MIMSTIMLKGRVINALIQVWTATIENSSLMGSDPIELSRPKHQFRRRRPMRSFSQITIEGRRVIQKMVYSGMNRQWMSMYLQRNRSTIYRELSRNCTKGYNAIEANNLACRRHHTRKGKLESYGIVRLSVCSLLMEKNSPEVISFNLRDSFPDDPGMHISNESIYQWVNSYREELARYLFTRRRNLQNRALVYKNGQFALENEGFGNAPRRRSTRQRLATWREILSSVREMMHICSPWLTEKLPKHGDFLSI